MFFLFDRLTWNFHIDFCKGHEFFFFEQKSRGLLSRVEEKSLYRRGLRKAEPQKWHGLKFLSIFSRALLKGHKFFVYVGR
jgi:hypothetical protein